MPYKLNVNIPGSSIITYVDFSHCREDIYYITKEVTKVKTDATGISKIEKINEPVHPYLSILSRYKLHLNLDDATYKENRDKIKEYIEEHGPTAGIPSFKFYNYSDESLKLDPEYKSINQRATIIKKILHIFPSLEKKDNDTEIKKQIVESKEMIDSTTNVEWKNYLSSILNKLKPDTHGSSSAMPSLKKEIEETLKDHFLQIESMERFIGQAQFTLYLIEPVKEENLVTFCTGLHQEFHKLNATPGNLPNTDLQISKFISFRQESLDETPDEYVGGVSSVNEDDKNTLIISKLKQQGAKCSVFKALSKAFFQEMNTIPSISSATAAGITTFQKKPDEAGEGIKEQSKTSEIKQPGPGG